MKYSFQKSQGNCDTQLPWLIEGTRREHRFKQVQDMIINKILTLLWFVFMAYLQDWSEDAKSIVFLRMEDSEHWAKHIQNAYSYGGKSVA